MCLHEFLMFCIPLLHSATPGCNIRRGSADNVHIQEKKGKEMLRGSHFENGERGMSKISQTFLGFFLNFFFFPIRLKCVFQPKSMISPMSNKRTFKPLSCQRDGELEEEGGVFVVCFIFWLVSRFAGHSCFPARRPCSPDGAPCATAAEATATTALRSARPQLSEPRVIGADSTHARKAGLGRQ